MEDVYRQYKPLLFSLAYRMLGVVSEAEDIVQETFLSLVQNDTRDIQHVKSYLCKAVTNRCLDTIKSARWRREQYVGEWLPEPVPDDWRENQPLDVLVKEEAVSYGLLVLLDALSPAERAVYVLRTALGFDYADIAGMLEKTEAGCRKLYSRAKQKLGEGNVQADPLPSRSKPLVERLIRAISQADTDSLIRLLSQDAVLVTDGGGKVKSALRPIFSDQRVAAFFVGVSKKWPAGTQMRIISMNGQPGILVWSAGHLPKVIHVMLDARQERIERLYMMTNPDKLTHFF